jgi:hypothetical protein
MEIAQQLHIDAAQRQLHAVYARGVAAMREPDAESQTPVQVFARASLSPPHHQADSAPGGGGWSARGDVCWAIDADAVTLRIFSTAASQLLHTMRAPEVRNYFQDPISCNSQNSI